MKAGAFSLALCLSSFACADQGKLSAVVFGDLFSASSHHDDFVKGQRGLMIRRINLTYDRTLDSKLMARVRLETNDPGDFKNGGLQMPFFKDMFLSYTLKDGKIVLGLQPTPTFSNLEETTGYRPVEKTPLDLYRYADPRDQGLSVKWAPTNTVGMHVMYGSAAGVRGRGNKGDALYGIVVVKVAPGLTAELGAENTRRGDGSVYRIAQGFLHSRKGNMNISAGLIGVRRETAGAADTKNSIITVYADTMINPRVKAFARIDHLSDPVPGADKIAYLALSKDASPTLFILGAEWKVDKNLSIIPNIEHISYRAFNGGAKPSSDTFLRVTFSSKF